MPIEVLDKHDLSGCSLVFYLVCWSIHCSLLLLRRDKCDYFDFRTLIYECITGLILYKIHLFVYFSTAYSYIAFQRYQRMCAIFVL